MFVMHVFLVSLKTHELCMAFEILFNCLEDELASIRLRTLRTNSNAVNISWHVSDSGLPNTCLNMQVSPTKLAFETNPVVT